MVKFYVNRIKNGGMTIDEVPSLWKKKSRGLNWQKKTTE